MAVVAALPTPIPGWAISARQARGPRFRALLLDLIAFSILAAIINNVYGVTQITSGSPIPNVAGATYFTTVTGVAWPWLVLVWLAYYIVPEGLFGASLGKLATGVRVVRVDGRPLGFGSIVTRNVLRLIDVLPGLYLVGGISVLVTANSQRVGDRWASTTVVRKDQVVEPLATRRPTPGVRRALGIVLVVGLLFTIAFDYFGRPPLVLESLYRQHQLMAADLTSYQLGNPQWGLGRVSYPLTAYEGQQACTGSISLNWSWPVGWTMSDGTLLCPP